LAPANPENRMNPDVPAVFCNSCIALLFLQKYSCMLSRKEAIRT
jgi:hypothetical protein